MGEHLFKHTPSISAPKDPRWNQFMMKKYGIYPASQQSEPLFTTFDPPADTSKYYQPSGSQIEFVSSYPTQCFCKKPAQRKYTLEYGPILECASFDSANHGDFSSKYICGFHVHERSWSIVVKNIQRGESINLECVSLRTCAQYNFTFNTIFKVLNAYPMTPPLLLPHCFCDRDVWFQVSRSGYIEFICRNRNTEGVGRCSWILPAIDVAFPKPTFRLHSLIDYDEYYSEIQKRRDLMNFTTQKYCMK